MPRKELCLAAALLGLGVLFLTLSLLHSHGHISGADGAVTDTYAHINLANLQQLAHCSVKTLTDAGAAQAVGCFALGLITFLPGAAYNYPALAHYAIMACQPRLTPRSLAGAYMSWVGVCAWLGVSGYTYDMIPAI